MTLHKFAIGQAVDFDKMLPSISRPNGPFEVVSVLSVDDANSPTYRIKSRTELFSRAVKAEKRPRRSWPIPRLDDGCLARSGRGDDVYEFRSRPSDRIRLF